MLIQPISCYGKNHKNEVNTCKEEYSTQMQNTGGRWQSWHNARKLCKQNGKATKFLIYRSVSACKDKQRFTPYRQTLLFISKGC